MWTSCSWCVIAELQRLCFLAVLFRLWWTPWWVLSPPSWMCCWCVSSSGSSSASWGSICLLESITTVTITLLRKTSSLTSSTTKQSVLHSSIQTTLKSDGKTSRSILTMWGQDTWHFCKWWDTFVVCFLFDYLFWNLEFNRFSPKCVRQLYRQHSKAGWTLCTPQ